MKPYLLFMLLLFATGISCSAQFSLQDSLIAWYPFDGDALDYSGNANHSLVNGPILTADRFGNPNSAYEFDGIDDFIEHIPNQKFTPQFPISISAWVLRGDYDFNPAFFNNFQEDVYSGVWLNIPSSGRVSAAFGDGGPVGPSSRRTKSGTTVLAINQWYHVGMIIRGPTDMDIYINGKRDCGTYSGTGNGLVYLNTTGSSGRADGLAQAGIGNYYFKGKLDEIRFYNRALAKPEIRILADFPPQDTILCQGDAYQLDAGYGNLISWNPTSDLSCTGCSDPIATPNTSTLYTAITANTPGCLDTVVIDLTVDPCDSCDLSLLLLGLNHVDCFGNNNGSFSLSAANGLGPYTYSIDGAVFTNDSVFTNLGAGTYAISILDADSCLIDTTFTVNQPLQLISNPTVSNISCLGAMDGSVSMSTTGGSPPYQYSINGGIFQVNPIFNNLVAGSYTILTEDSNGCSSSATVSIIEPPLLAIDSIQIANPSCFNSNDGQLIAFGSGGTSNYFWSLNNGVSQSNSSFTQLGPGNYSLALIDANACIDSISFTLSSPPPIQASMHTDSANCNGGSDGSISISATGGLGSLAYSLNNGGVQTSNIFSNLNAASYQVTVTDSIGCMLTQSISVLEPNALQINLLSQTGINCLGDSSATISVQGMGGTSPYLFSLNNGTYQSDSSFVGLDSGQYIIFIRDVNLCEDSLQLSIGSYQALNAMAQIVSNYNGSDISCFGSNDGIIQVNATAGIAPYTYSWSNGATTSLVNSLSPGQHIAWVTDSFGCIDSAIIILNQPDPLSSLGNILSDYNGFAISCFGGQDGAVAFQTVGGIPPYQYIWPNGSNSNTQNNLIAGNYSTTIVDANGCMAHSDTIALIEPTAISLDFIVDSTNCHESNDGSILSSPHGGVPPYQYNWSPAGPNNPLLPNLASGIYQLSVSDTNNCQKDSSISIYSPPPIQILTDKKVAPNCGDNNGLLSVSAVGGNGSSYQFYWSPPLDINGPEVRMLQAGVYEVIATDTKGCVAIKDFDLQTILFPIADFELTNPDTIRFTLSEAEVFVNNLSQNAQIFQWDWGDGSSSSNTNPSHQYLNEGIYTIVLTAFDISLDCFDTDSITIEIIPDGSIYIPNAFSPNNDGHNDQFLILGEGIVSLELIIFSRWGMEIFRQQDYPVSWNGTNMQNQAVPEGVYTFKLQARLNNNALVERAGTITLIR